MKILQKRLFAAVCVVSVRATLAMKNLASSPWSDAKPWAVATLYDAYCGWGWGMAMSVYVLKELMNLKLDEPVTAALQPA